MRLVSTHAFLTARCHRSWLARPSKLNARMAALTPSKRGAALQIGTHDGSFHCDEALGCAMLKHTSAFGSAAVVRSRKPEVLAACDLVLDVGGVYDPATNKFDHHQKEFNDVFGHGFATRLSSAGLVYKHFGREVVASLLSLPPSDPKVEAVYLRVYKSFMQAVDAIDNGVNQFGPDAVSLYENGTGLASRVGRLNAPWNGDFSSPAQDAQFAKAVALTGAEFAEEVRYVAHVWLPGREPVASALAARHAAHPSGRILVLPSFCPWKEHLFELEAEQQLPADALPLFVLFRDDASGSWRVSTVPSAPGGGGFGFRRGLATAWRGLRDDALAAASGVAGAVFVHVAGFIGGASTQEGALAMAVKSLELE